MGFDVTFWAFETTSHRSERHCKASWAASDIEEISMLLRAGSGCYAGRWERICLTAGEGKEAACIVCANASGYVCSSGVFF